MNDISARWDITACRSDDPYDIFVRVIGPNLTGVPMRMQVRRAPGLGGEPLIDLAIVTNGNQEGTVSAEQAKIAGFAKRPGGKFKNRRR